MAGKINLDPALAYEIVVKALDVIGSASPSVHRRIERAYDTSTPTSYPVVSAWAVVELRRALNKIPPGDLAEGVIEAEDQRRRERKEAHARKVREANR